MCNESKYTLGYFIQVWLLSLTSPLFVVSYHVTVLSSIQHAGTKKLDTSLDVSQINSLPQQSTLITTAPYLGMYPDPHNSNFLHITFILFSSIKRSNIMES